MSESVHVQSRGVPGRCAYCHGQVGAEERVACRDCLASHHRDCFSRSCAACGSTSVLGSATPLLDQDVKKWAMLCHLAAFAGFVVPFGNVIGPLIVWHSKKDLHPFVDRNGREALNFQLTLLLANFAVMGIMIACGIASALADNPAILFAGFPFLVIFALVMLASWIVTGYAAFRANEGRGFRYFAIRFLGTPPEAPLAPPSERERVDPKAALD